MNIGNLARHAGAALLASATLSTWGAEGLVGHYYSGYSVVSNRIVFEGLPLMSTRTNTVFDFWDGSRYHDWNPIGNGYYTVHWSGYLHITESGTYGFGTISDDGSEIWIDGHRVVDNNEEQWYDWQEAYCYLGAGYHTIEITLYEAESYSGIEVWWLRPSQGISELPYTGETFHSTPPVFNSSTLWEILTAPAISTEAPFVNPYLMIHPGASPHSAALTWPGYTNVDYYLESSTTLTNWTGVGGAIPGISGTMTQTVNQTQPHTFFRLRLE